MCLSFGFLDADDRHHAARLADEVRRIDPGFNAKRYGAPTFGRLLARMSDGIEIIPREGGALLKTRAA